MKSTITIIRGDHEALDFTFTNSDGTAFDLTGYTVTLTVKKVTDLANDDDNAVIQKSTAIHTDPTGGETTIELTKTETAIDPDERYKYDIELVDAGAEPKSTKPGEFVVINDVKKT